MVGILLAAGFSRRFGSANKLMQTLPNGVPIAVASARQLMNALPICVAVVRPDNAQLAQMLRALGLHVTFCADDAATMSDSLICGIRFAAQLSTSCDGFVIALADMPYIQTATIHAVADTLKAGALIAMPTYQQQRGHPVGFATKLTDELLQLDGDEGARSIVKRHAAEVVTIACDDKGILADIDTPADLERVKNWY